MQFLRHTLSIEKETAVSENDSQPDAEEDPGSGNSISGEDHEDAGSDAGGEEPMAPEISIFIQEGPLCSSQDDICYYRIGSEVYGNPFPSVTWSKDDSDSSFGEYVAQVNLRRGETYTLIATASNSEGTATSSSVTVTVDDGKGGTDSRTESFSIAGNRPPEVGEIVIKNSPGGDTAGKIIVNYDYTLHISASDPDWDSLSYHWEVTAGTLGNAYSNPASWRAPYYPGFVDIKVTVDDGNGETVIRTRKVEVGYYVN